MRTRPLAFLPLLALAAAARADHFDAYDDFSLAANPNGAWSYGVEATPGAAFSLMPNAQSGNLQPANTPYEVWNTGNEAVIKVFDNNTPLWPKGLLFDAEYGAKSPVIRWTAPEDYLGGTIGWFAGTQYGASTTGYVLRNGQVVDSFSISPNVRFGGSLGAVHKGDTLDFTIPAGGTTGFVTTSLLTIDAFPASVPEPASLAALGLGTMALLRKRKLG